MREIVSMQLGQCGNKVGEKVREKLNYPFFSLNNF